MTRGEAEVGQGAGPFPLGVPLEASGDAVDDPATVGRQRLLARRQLFSA